MYNRYIDCRHLKFMHYQCYQLYSSQCFGDTQEKLDHGVELIESEGLTSQHYHKKLQAAKGWGKLRVDALHTVQQPLYAFVAVARSNKTAV